MPSGCCFCGTARFIHQLYRGAQTTEELFGKISDTLTVLAQGGELHA